VEGVTSVQRVVCGSCFDFKVVTKLSAAAFGEWEKMNFAPEAEFLETLKSIDGVSSVETQTYTLEEVMLSKKQIKRLAEQKKKASQSKEEDKPEVEKTPEELAEERKKTVECGNQGGRKAGRRDRGRC